jgi:hypothetical protein
MADWSPPPPTPMRFEKFPFERIFSLIPKKLLSVMDSSDGSSGDEFVLIFSILLAVICSCCLLMICRFFKPDCFDENADEENGGGIQGLNLPELPHDEDEKEQLVEGEPDLFGEKSPTSERALLINSALAYDDELGEDSSDIPPSSSIYTQSPAARNTNFITSEDEIPKPYHHFPMFPLASPDQAVDEDNEHL